MAGIGKKAQNKTCLLSWNQGGQWHGRAENGEKTIVRDRKSGKGRYWNSPAVTSSQRKTQKRVVKQKPNSPLALGEVKGGNGEKKTRLRSTDSRGKNLLRRGQVSLREKESRRLLSLRFSRRKEFAQT